MCKYDDPDKWDLDMPGWRKGRRDCILECPVREACLRKALQTDDPPVIGVVRGGVVFDINQQRKKKSLCLLCGYPVAEIKMVDGKKTMSICWICRRFAPCLNQCGRMVLRKPGLVSYYCPYCSK